MEKIATGVMTKLKYQQSGFAVDAEIKSEVIVDFVIKLGGLSNSWHPIFQILHIGIRTWFRNHPMGGQSIERSLLMP